MMSNDGESWIDERIKSNRDNIEDIESFGLDAEEQLADVGLFEFDKILEALKAAMMALRSCKVGSTWYGDGPIFDVRLVDIAITKIDELGK